MNVAIIGSGGREHALTWKLQRDLGDQGTVYTLPGNGGTPHSHPIQPSDFGSIERFCLEHAVSLVVVGPEDPLNQGIVDYLAPTGIQVFGPSRAGARLEGSKAYARQFMARYGVASPAWQAFDSPDEALPMCEEHDGFIVVKYDGLAAGKGVFVCDSMDQARWALDELSERYGDQARVVMEERLIGAEVSIIGLTDGKDIKLLLPSQDHKQRFEGDQGPNTGGMGAFCPVPGYTPELHAEVVETIIQPTLRGIQEEGFRYRGVIYFGLMITTDGPKVLEYNVRLGDPETEVVLPALDSSLLDLILGCVRGELASVPDPVFSSDTFVDVVLASAGYPGRYEKGKEITGLEGTPEDTLVFHAGTVRRESLTLTAGGRVLNVVGRGANLQSAIRAAYAGVESISFHGKVYREDIGRREWPF